MIEINSNFLGWDIFLNITIVGEDIMLQVYGGSRPHLGAAVLAVHSNNINSPHKSDCTLSVLSLVGHKESDLFTMIARRVCKTLNKNCLVSGGIHIDNLSYDQVNALIDCVLLMTEKAINRIKEITL